MHACSNGQSARSFQKSVNVTIIERILIKWIKDWCDLECNISQTYQKLQLLIKVQMKRMTSGIDFQCQNLRSFIWATMKNSNQMVLKWVIYYEFNLIIRLNIHIYLLEHKIMIKANDIKKAMNPSDAYSQLVMSLFM